MANSAPIRDVLLLLDADRPCCCALDAALSLAEGERAVVHTLCLAPDKDEFRLCRPDQLVSDHLDRRPALGGDLLHAMKDSFFKRLSAVSLGGDWQSIDEIDAPFVAPIRGGNCDISVMQADLARHATGRQLAEALLRKGGCACLFVPHGFQQPADFDQIVVAWSSPAAARQAIPHALPLLKRASMTHVVVTGDPGEIESYDDAAAIIAELTRHGVTCRARLRRCTSPHATKDLVSVCDELEADLLILDDRDGLYAADTIVGDIAFSLLVDAGIPILLSR